MCSAFQPLEHLRIVVVSESGAEATGACIWLDVRLHGFTVPDRSRISAQVCASS
jgi:hypothetical protein